MLCESRTETRTESQIKTGEASGQRRWDQENRSLVEGRACNLSLEMPHSDETMHPTDFVYVSG